MVDRDEDTHCTLSRLSDENGVTQWVAELVWTEGQVLL